MEDGCKGLHNRTRMRLAARNVSLAKRIFKELDCQFLAIAAKGLNACLSSWGGGTKWSRPKARREGLTPAEKNVL